MTWQSVVVAVGITLGVTLLGSLIFANLTAVGPRRIEHRIHPRHHVEDPSFLRTMGSLLGPAILPGNRVDTLQDGDEGFGSMLEAIRAAERTVVFETYVYWSGTIGREFAEAFASKAREGVRVHVLVDWAGSQSMDRSAMERMAESGVEIRHYRPPHWYELTRMNRRTHRKILVVDGRIGFTGGIGIADVWRGRGQDPEHWRDLHYRVQGPCVSQMQAAFLDNWMEATGEILHGDDYFPELPAAGHYLAQVFKSVGDDGSESARVMYLLSIALAQRSILVASSYFVPDRVAVRALVDACRRGVAVEIIVPGEHMDIPIVQMASRWRWGPLLAAGVSIHEYRPTMYHVKLLIIDDLWVSVGSTNFDPRSFRLNDEVNLNVYDRGFALEQRAIFEADRARSRPVTLEEWRTRPIRQKVLDRLAAVFRSQL